MGPWENSSEIYPRKEEDGEIFAELNDNFPSNCRIVSRAGSSTGSTTVYICHSLGEGAVRADIVLDQLEELNTARQLG